MKTIFTILFALAVSVSQAQQTHEIDWMVGVNGEAASVTIEVGDTVLWTWSDELPHSVVSTDPDAPEDFGSEIVTGDGETYSYTFTEATVFDYNCSVHEGTMFGTITVEEGLNVADTFVQQLRYFPNPVQEELLLESAVPVQHIAIVSMQGKLLATEEPAGQSTRHAIATGSLTPGIYFLQVTGLEGQSATFKFIKQ